MSAVRVPPRYQHREASAPTAVHEALASHLVEIITDAADRAGNDRVAKITRDILDYHATPVDAAESAQAAGVGHLLYNHIVPPLLLPPMAELFGCGWAGLDDLIAAVEWADNYVNVHTLQNLGGEIRGQLE